MKRSASSNHATAASENIQDTGLHQQLGSDDKRRKHDDADAERYADGAEVASHSRPDDFTMPRPMVKAEPLTEVVAGSVPNIGAGNGEETTADPFTMPRPMMVKEEPHLDVVDSVPNIGNLLVRSVSQINRSTDSSPAELPIATTVTDKTIPKESAIMETANAEPIATANAPNASDGVELANPTVKTEIKTEIQIKDDPDPPPPIPTNGTDALQPSTSTSTSATASSSSIGVPVKLDPDAGSPPVAASPTTAAPSSASLPTATVIQTAPLRPVCNFGIKCFRRNLQHRNDMAHPGDPDYRRPAFPPAPPGTPDCPFGARCYRRNPAHFQQLSHPSSDVYNTDLMGGGPMPMPRATGGCGTVTPAAAANLRPRVLAVYTARDDIRGTGTDDTDYEDDEEDPYMGDSSSDEFHPTDSANEYEEEDYLASSDSEVEY